MSYTIRAARIWDHMVNDFTIIAVALCTRERIIARTGKFCLISDAISVFKDSWTRNFWSSRQVILSRYDSLYILHLLSNFVPIRMFATTKWCELFSGDAHEWALRARSFVNCASRGSIVENLMSTFVFLLERYTVGCVHRATVVHSRARIWLNLSSIRSVPSSYSSSMMPLPSSRPPFLQSFSSWLILAYIRHFFVDLYENQIPWKPSTSLTDSRLSRSDKKSE